MRRVTIDAYPGRTFHGRVDFIYPEVDMNTRTVKVRLVFSESRARSSRPACSST